MYFTTNHLQEKNQITGSYGLVFMKTVLKLSGRPSYKHLFFTRNICILVNRFKRAGYSLDIMRQTSSLVFNPIMVEGFAALFSCTAVVQASDSMTASM